MYEYFMNKHKNESASIIQMNTVLCFPSPCCLRLALASLNSIHLPHSSSCTPNILLLCIVKLNPLTHLLPAFLTHLFFPFIFIFLFSAELLLLFFVPCHLMIWFDSHYSTLVLVAQANKWIANMPARKRWMGLAQYHFFVQKGSFKATLLLLS